MLAAILTLAVTLMAPYTDGQVIAVGAPGGPVMADINGNLAIDVGTVITPLVIRIFDPATDHDTGPTLSVATVTITGTAGVNGKLRVLVANSIYFDFDPTSDNPLDLWLSGVVNFGNASGGGLIIHNPGNPGDTTLRDATHLALAATGNVAGDIDVGRVFRIQALGVTDPETGDVIGGTISSNITTYVHNDFSSQQGNGFEPIGSCAIKVIAAGNAVTGTITANSDVAIDHDHTNETYASIGRVEVGPWLEAAGITGDIIAANGRIVQVYSTGPIGTPSAASTIVAANGIREIRAGPAGSAEVLARDLNVNILSGVLPSAFGQSQFDGPLGNILTGGAIHGSIEAENLSFDATSPSLGGIIAQGPITASITVLANMLDSNIIGSSITGSVWVGWLAQGCIVATGVDPNDPNGGHINAVRIGYGSVIPLYQDLYRPGMSGSYCPPVQVLESADWYESQCIGGGTSDSVIHADSIGLLRISSMSQVYGTVFGTQDLIIKTDVPRVEANTIGTLVIGDMRAGVVWSGELEYTSGVIDNAVENDYASIGAMTIGCIGPGADVWFADCERAVIEHDVFGELHLPVLASGETIWIGDRLGDGPAENTPAELEECVCGNQVAAECFYTQGAHQEDSPRDPGYAALSAIHVREVEGLSGQIIINGNNTEVAADTGWAGKGVIGPGFGNLIELGPSQEQPFEAPYYDLLPAAIGGGSIGLVPFHLHKKACTPPHGILVGERDLPLVYTDFDGPNHPVIIRSYGPVTSATVNIEMGVLASECPASDLTVMFIRTLAPPPNNNPREIGIRCTSVASMKEGAFRVLPTGVFSDDVVGEPQVVWPLDACSPQERRYLFAVGPDCNANGVDDRHDIDLGDEFPNDNLPDLDIDDNDVIDSCTYKDCRCDWDRSGTFTVSDIFAFLSAWFAQCDGSGGTTTPPCYGRDADFNGTNGVDVPDIFAFLSCWFASQGENCNV